MFIYVCVCMTNTTSGSVKTPLYMINPFLVLHHHPKVLQMHLTCQSFRDWPPKACLQLLLTLIQQLQIQKFLHNLINWWHRPHLWLDEKLSREYYVDKGMLKFAVMKDLHPLVEWRAVSSLSLCWPLSVANEFWKFWTLHYKTRVFSVSILTTTRSLSSSGLQL